MAGVAGLMMGAIALVRDGSVDSPDQTEPVSIDASSTSPEVTTQPQSIRRLRASAEPWIVHLTWTAPRGTQIDSYQVERDGRTIGSSSQLSFDDDTVLPGVTYRYSVVAVSPGGEKARHVGITVRSPNASQAVAAISGTFNFQMHAASQFGYKKGSYLGTYWIGIEFEPVCGVGCSSVTFRYTDGSGIAGVMHRTPEGFAGTTSGDWGVTCGKKASISQFTWDITILAAAPDNTLNQLVADELRATVRILEPARNGCRASGVTFEGTAS